MFSNVGEKIKGWAKFIFVMTLITSLISGFSTISMIKVALNFKGAGFIIFLIAVGLIILSVCLSIFVSLLVYGFGIIVSKNENQECSNSNNSFLKSVTSEGYNSSLFKDMENARAPKGTIEAGEWLCPKCGKTNQNYVSTCGCGEVKPTANKTNINSKWLICPNCGQKQDPNRTSCFKCGTKFE